MSEFIDILPEITPFPFPLSGKGFVVWVNKTNEYIEVKTFDEKDAIRWIAYETRKIAPGQGVQLTARGDLIHIYVGNNGATYDCKKGETYIFDGINASPKS